MKRLILSVLFLGFLTGCPSQEEVKNMQQGISERKEVAIKFLDAKDYSLEGLLKVQDYFFDFSEKVHLIKVEADAQKNVQKMIKKKGGAKAFCKDFILPVKYWEPLEAYCSNGTFYKCSPEIKEYKNTLAKLKELIGTASAKALNNESSCK